MAQAKRFLSIILVFLAVISMCSCNKKAHGIAGMLEVARDKIPSKIAKNQQINLSAIINKDDSRLVFFKVGTETSGYQYFPIEFKTNKKLEYRFVRTFNITINRCEDTVILDWKGDYNFFIDNKECKTLRIIQTNGKSKDIIVSKYPFTYSQPTVSISEYYFLDADGREI